MTELKERIIMKILLFLICFIATAVFAGEPKEQGAGIKDATGKNSNNFSRGLHNNGALKNDPVKSKNNKVNKVWTDGNATSIQKPESTTEIWTNGGASTVKKPGSKKPACSLHDSVHC